MPTVQPVWADKISDSFGVNVHYSFSTTVYGNSSSVTDLVKDLKVRYVRDRMSPNPGAQRTQFGVLAADGIKAHVSMGVYNDTTQAQMNSYVAAIDLNPSYIASVGGCNEPNDEPRLSSWATIMKNHQQMLWNTMISYGLGSVPVVAGALKDNVSNLHADFITAGATGIGAYCDKADYHKYPLGGGGKATPSNGHQDRINWSVAAYGGPPWCTETGMNNSNSRTPEWVTGIYAPRLLMETFYRGVERTFMYELLDDPDSTGEALESHFGLVRTPVGSTNNPSAWGKKPAFNSLAALSVAMADPGAPVTPVSITLTVTGGGSDLRWVCAGKRDGSYYLVLWRDTAVYDHSTKKAVTVPLNTITVNSSVGNHTVDLTGTLLVLNLGTGSKATVGGGTDVGVPQPPPPPPSSPGVPTVVVPPPLVNPPVSEVPDLAGGKEVHRRVYTRGPTHYSG